jgi:prephenate dehydratase
MKVSIQGIKGAFHQQAAEDFFEAKVDILPQSTFSGLVDSVVDEQAPFGIMAIENTISGTIHNNFNLIRQSGLKIIGEVYLRIEQNLAVIPGTKIEDLKQVESHYMAINQCREFFKKFPKIKLIESEDTASSLKKVAEEQLHRTGAIGSQLAAEEYGLEIIEKSIETNKKNYTRFLILSKTALEESKNLNKASLALMLPHQKGSLARVLSLIDLNDIDLSKIESLPIIGEPWHYLFYIDLHFSSYQQFQKMLKDIKAFTDAMEILGVYAYGQKSFQKINTNNYDTSH